VDIGLNASQRVGARFLKWWFALQDGAGERKRDDGGNGESGGWANDESPA